MWCGEWCDVRVRGVVSGVCGMPVRGACVVSGICGVCGVMCVCVVSGVCGEWCMWCGEW